MSNTMTLSDGTTTVDLTASSGPYLRSGGAATPPPANTITYAGSRQRDGAIPAFEHRENSQHNYDIVIAGSTPDAVLDNLRNITKLIRESTRYWRTAGTQGARCKLTIGVNNGTHTTEWDVLAGSCDPGSWATPNITNASNAYLEQAKLTLICSPFGQETSDVVSINTSLANSGPTVTLSNVRGEVEVPAQFKLKLNQSFSGNISALWIARRTRGTVANFVYKAEGEAGTGFSGYVSSHIETLLTYSTGTVAGTSNGHTGQWNASGGSVTLDRAYRFVIDPAVSGNHPSDNYGQFHVFVRWRSLGGTINGVALMYYGTATTPTKTPQSGSVTVALSATDWSMTDLGLIQWPDTITPPNVNAKLVFEVALTLSVSTGVEIDYFLIVPVDESFLYLNYPSIPFASGDVVIADGTVWPETIYTVDSSGNVKTATQPATQTGTFPKVAPGTNLWLLYFDQMGNSATPGKDVLADTIDATITYRPRYEFLRGS